jgi:hypothetical protein
MQIPSPTRIATLSLLVGGLACARNSANEDVGAARDTTRVDTIAPSMTARDTAGVPDSSKPVTPKGDTLHEVIDSSAIYRDPTSSTTRQTVVDSSMSPEGADRSAADSATADSSTTAR